MDDSGFLGFVGFVVLCFIFGFTSYYIFIVKENPTAMDVYQGKTTLKYTIVDGVKTDSCVIWKNKEK